MIRSRRQSDRRMSPPKQTYNYTYYVYVHMHAQTDTTPKNNAWGLIYRIGKGIQIKPTPKNNLDNYKHDFKK